ncbi:MAG: alkaline phosphatase family protein [Gemmatimonadaceae bacterium]
MLTLVHTRIRTLVTTGALASVLAGAVTAQPPAGGAAPRLPPAPADVPSLVVFITVDQLRPDYLERFGAQLTGGLARLTRGGAVFTNAFQDHATTETAPGHASTMSGRFPRSTGIVRNTAGVNDPQGTLLEAFGPGASPFRFRGSTLTDWLRAKDPRSRALSVSRKDRGAILPIGRSPEEVYWYASNGTFTTSVWYHDTLPSWVRRFNDRKLPQSYAGRAWTPLLPDSAYAEADAVAAEDAGRGGVFPHTMPTRPDSAAAFFGEFPWMDEVTLALAMQGLREMQLGAGPQTDVLAISLSTTDAIGHRYGPDSKELHDQVLRLDRMLGTFFDSLFAVRNPARVVVALTADHGVSPYPDVRAARGEGRAVRVQVPALLGTFRRTLAERGVDSSAFSFDDFVLFVNRPAFARAKVPADSVITAFAAHARATPGVLRVDAVRSLAGQDTVRDAIARRWYHSLPPDLGAELTVTLQPYAAWDYAPNIVSFAEHGSPHDYDAHVPVIFYGRPFKAGRYADFVRVVDMAPTLAWTTATEPTERLDGRILWQALAPDGVGPGTR